MPRIAFCLEMTPCAGSRPRLPFAQIVEKSSKNPGKFHRALVCIHAVLRAKTSDGLDHAGLAGSMTIHRTVIQQKKSWDTVLTSATHKPFTFDILGISPAGDEVTIRNSDSTVTILVGRGLAAEKPAINGAGARLTAGTIADIVRASADGVVLEVIKGANVPATGSEDVASFSRPIGNLQSIAWVLADTSAAAHITTAKRGLHGGGAGKPVSILIPLIPLAIGALLTLWLMSRPG